RAQGASDRRLLLDKFIPQIFIISNRVQPCGEANVVPMPCKEVHAKGMDGSKTRATERLHSFERQTGFQNPLPCALLHLVRCAVRVCDNHKLGEPFNGSSPISRDVDDTVSDGASLSRPGRSNHRKISM